jgi:hypothetical protein
MRDHVKIVAILNIVLGCLGVLGGVVVLLIFGGLAGMIGISHDQDAASAMPIFAFIGGCIAIFLFVISVPAIIGGWGLLNFRPWARILMIIISALNLLHFPLGTALGIYGLIVLLNDDTRRLFETGGAYVPPPAYPQPYPPGGAPPAYPQQTYPQPPPPPPGS